MSDHTKRAADNFSIALADSMIRQAILELKKVSSVTLFWKQIHVEQLESVSTDLNKTLKARE